MSLYFGICVQEVRQGRRAAQNVQPNQEVTDEDVLDASLGKLAANANELDLDQVRGLI